MTGIRRGPGAKRLHKKNMSNKICLSEAFVENKLMNVDADKQENHRMDELSATVAIYHKS